MRRSGATACPGVRKRHLQARPLAFTETGDVQDGTGVLVQPVERRGVWASPPVIAASIQSLIRLLAGPHGAERSEGRPRRGWRGVRRWRGISWIDLGGLDPLRANPAHLAVTETFAVGNAAEAWLANGAGHSSWVNPSMIDDRTG